MATAVSPPLLFRQPRIPVVTMAIARMSLCLVNYYQNDYDDVLIVEDYMGGFANPFSLMMMATRNGARRRFWIAGTSIFKYTGRTVPMLTRIKNVPIMTEDVPSATMVTETTHCITAVQCASKDSHDLWAENLKMGACVLQRLRGRSRVRRRRTVTEQRQQQWSTHHQLLVVMGTHQRKVT